MPPPRSTGGLPHQHNARRAALPTHAVMGEVVDIVGVVALQAVPLSLLHLFFPLLDCFLCVWVWVWSVVFLWVFLGKR